MIFKMKLYFAKFWTKIIRKFFVYEFKLSRILFYWGSTYGIFLYYSSFFVGSFEFSNFMSFNTNLLLDYVMQDLTFEINTYFSNFDFYFETLNFAPALLYGLTAGDVFFTPMPIFWKNLFFEKNVNIIFNTLFTTMNFEQFLFVSSNHLITSLNDFIAPSFQSNSFFNLNFIKNVGPFSFLFFFGKTLFINFFMGFILCGFLLLFAMLGAILILLKTKRFHF